ncbi:hypothetical protein TNIN_489591 [Trichonephila inaurata madagascariensis]|uniref:Uncharacterized protein n=1 Tax=Trichonephila inaurata madagascariensis TaxID=2747483 RepID=A0A8X7CPX9_9ARAC|nr:hypothetical protein TNIN_489591 [Trichonephila inaurata madagascariensis]
MGMGSASALGNCNVWFFQQSTLKNVRDREKKIKNSRRRNRCRSGTNYSARGSALPNGSGQMEFEITKGIYRLFSPSCCIPDLQKKEKGRA